MKARSSILSLGLLLAAGGCHAAGMGSAGGAVAHTLRIGYVNDPSSLNPLFAYAQTQIDLCDLYTETLVGLDWNNNLVGLLAQRVPSLQNGGISADGLTITYHLRPQARFADGVPFTSTDVLFTYRAILDPANPVTAPDMYRRIAWMRAPDAHTIVLRLKRRWAAATAELLRRAILPTASCPRTRSVTIPAPLRAVTGTIIRSERDRSACCAGTAQRRSCLRPTHTRGVSRYCGRSS